MEKFRESQGGRAASGSRQGAEGQELWCKRPQKVRGQRVSGHPFPTTPRVSFFPQPAKAKMPDTVPKNSGVSLPTEPSGAIGAPHWAVTSDLSGQLVSRENAGAHGGLRGEQPGDPAPALQGRARRPHREMDTPPEA